MTVDSEEALAVIVECNFCHRGLGLGLQMQRTGGDAVMNVSICKAQLEKKECFNGYKPLSGRIGDYPLPGLSKGGLLRSIGST